MNLAGLRFAPNLMMKAKAGTKQQPAAALDAFCRVWDEQHNIVQCIDLREPRGVSCVPKLNALLSRLERHRQMAQLWRFFRTRSFTCGGRLKRQTPLPCIQPSFENAIVGRRATTTKDSSRQSVVSTFYNSHLGFYAQSKAWKTSHLGKWGLTPCFDAFKRCISCDLFLSGQQNSNANTLLVAWV